MACQLLTAGFPLCAQRVMQALTDGIGERKQLTIAIKFDCLLRGIKNNLAVMATLEMKLQHAFQLFIHVPVQVACNLSDRVFAVHECLTSFKSLA